MVAVPLGYGFSDRNVGKFPGLVTRNMFAERPATDPNALALVSRAGLEAFTSAGSGPIRAIFQRAGLFDGDMLVLSGATLYRVTTAGVATAFTGSVPGTTRVRIDAGPNADGNSEARIALGSDGVYLAIGTTVSTEAFPDDAGVTDVMYLRGFWIAVRADTQVLYSRVPGDTAWDAITFTSAEYEPDKVVGLGKLGDTVLVLGEASVEPFALTGTAANPLAPYGGSAEDIGCRARDTIVSNLPGAVFMVGNDCAVYKMTPSPVVVSDNGIAEKIRLADAMDLRAWAFSQDQHDFLVISLGTETIVYDDATKLWATWTSDGYDYFRGHLGCSVLGEVFAADSLTNSGQLWRVNPEKLTDAGDEIDCIGTGFYQMQEGSTVCSNLVLECARGWAPISGQGSDPLVGMRYSDDQGATWSGWSERTLGAMGRYRDKARWNALGTIRAPGRMFQFKATDPTVRRFSRLNMNVVGV